MEFSQHDRNCWNENLLVSRCWARREVSDAMEEEGQSRGTTASAVRFRGGEWEWVDARWQISWRQGNAEKGQSQTAAIAVRLRGGGAGGGFGGESGPRWVIRSHSEQFVRKSVSR